MGVGTLEILNAKLVFITATLESGSSSNLGRNYRYKGYGNLLGYIDEVDLGGPMEGITCTGGCCMGGHRSEG